MEQLREGGVMLPPNQAGVERQCKAETRTLASSSFLLCTEAHPSCDPVREPRWSRTMLEQHWHCWLPRENSDSRQSRYCLCYWTTRPCTQRFVPPRAQSRDNCGAETEMSQGSGRGKSQGSEGCLFFWSFCLPDACDEILNIELDDHEVGCRREVRVHTG